MARTPLIAVMWLVLAMGVAPVSAEDRELSAQCRAAKGAPALDICKRAVKASPSDQALQQRLGYLHVDLGHYQEAIGVFRAMTKKWPESWRAHYDLATVHSYIRAYGAALPAIEAAVKRNSRSIDALTLAVVIYRNLKRNKDAFALALQAAGLGDIGSMAITAYNYEAGTGTAKNEAKSLHWLRRAALGGHVGAMNQMSALYLNGGLGLKPNEGKAKMWARKSRQARFGDMKKK